MKGPHPVRAVRKLVARWGSLLLKSLDGRDLLMLSGLGLLSTGSYLIYAPAALLVSGSLLWYLGVWHR